MPSATELAFYLFGLLDGDEERSMLLLDIIDLRPSDASLIDFSLLFNLERSVGLRWRERERDSPPQRAPRRAHGS